MLQPAFADIDFMNSGTAVLDRSKKYRLLTRSDFDGLVCAILLKSLDILDSISFVHPKDVQDGKIEILPNDILTNLPYVPGCHLCFDHHGSEALRAGNSLRANHILAPGADSAARVLYRWYGGAEVFPHISEEMMSAVDKADSAAFTATDILHPQGWDLLSFIMDPRTGLGRFREFRVSNYQLMMTLIDHCGTHPITETLNLPDVRERVEIYCEHEERFAAQIRRCTRIFGTMAVLDLREEPVIYVGNRFMIYAMFPECDISMHVLWGLRKAKTVLAIGKSILNRTCTVKVDELVLKHGGGGHEAAGTCQVDNELAPATIREIILRVKAIGRARESERELLQSDVA